MFLLLDLTHRYASGKYNKSKNVKVTDVEAVVIASSFHSEFG